MSSASFDRNKRLLTPRDYQSVFDDATYKVGHKHFLLLAVPNGRGYPRLGLVVGKKNIRLATDRNRLKRVVRETFRRRQTTLDSLDIVFLARKGFDGLDTRRQNVCLAEGWRRLSEKAGAAVLT